MKYKLTITDIESPANGSPWFWLPRGADKVSMTIYDEQQQKLVEYNEPVNELEYVKILLRTAVFENSGFNYKWTLTDWTLEDDMDDADDSEAKIWPAVQADPIEFENLFEDNSRENYYDIHAEFEYPTEINVCVTADQLADYKGDLPMLASDMIKNYLPLTFEITV